MLHETADDVEILSLIGKLPFLYHNKVNFNKWCRLIPDRNGKDEVKCNWMINSNFINSKIEGTHKNQEQKRNSFEEIIRDLTTYCIKTKAGDK